MIQLPYTTDNVTLVQDFINETRTRIMNGQEITFSSKASQELEELALEYDITASDIEHTILNLP